MSSLSDNQRRGVTYVTLEVPTEIDDALRARAKNEDRSKSAVIRQAIRADLASAPELVKVSTR